MVMRIAEETFQKNEVLGWYGWTSNVDFFNKKVNLWGSMDLEEFKELKGGVYFWQYGTVS